ASCSCKYQFDESKLSTTALEKKDNFNVQHSLDI
ncbi:unnamed protein product, partial [Rotaria sordida]